MSMYGKREEEKTGLKNDKNNGRYKKETGNQKQEPAEERLTGSEGKKLENDCCGIKFGAASRICLMTGMHKN